MKMKRSYYLIVVAVTLVAFAWLLYRSSAGIGEIPQQAAAGKKVFQDRSCIQCHSLLGNGGYYGGDLTRVYDRLGEVRLKERLIDPPLITGAQSKRHMSVSAADAERLAQYLRFVATIQTGEWPPRQLTK